ncbi:MAG: Crp/Fnr family transcriptional regulator [Deltaproteobacteria bacterium]|nr:Crp/Fnr family transcriptional regulator [Deltaproteobacteria bacterium]
MENEQALRALTLFEDLSDEMLVEVDSITIRKKVCKGESIFFAGQEGDRFYGIANGSVKIFKLSAEGNEQILHIFGEGEIFAEVAVFAGSTFPANARALEASELLIFRRDLFIALLSKNADLALKMLGILSARLRIMAFLVESISLKSVSGRVSSYLLGVDHKERNWFPLTASKGDLARMLGTIPETFSRSLRRLQEQGIIEVAGKKVRIVDYNALGEIAKIE